jgi:tRNA (guanine26-N2/guanine27-N2)-dimethyltransferase
MKTERQVKFEVGAAFYNPGSRLGRDLAVLAARVQRDRVGSLRVLDAMTGCGVRPLRYLAQSQADWVWANEGNPDILPWVERNLERAIASGQVQVTCSDANRVFFDCFNRRDYYDLVDVDCFGSPAPYLHSALRAVRLGGLLYLTSTDGRTATGHRPEAGLGVYGAFPRSHPAAREQGLRLLMGALQQQAATQDLGIEPVFSLFSGEIYRVMVRVVTKVRLSDRNYGFLGYCHACGEYQTIGWRKLGKACCVYDEQPLTLSGPMDLGALHDRALLAKMAAIAREWHWSDCVAILELMQAEADFPPYFYRLGDIGKRGKLDIPPRSRLIEILRDRGYRATPTHLNPEAIKTNADLHICIELARQL